MNGEKWYVPPSLSIEWYTPKFIFDGLDVEFDLDVAAPENRDLTHVPAKNYFTLKDDALEKPWFGFVWMNPPFGRYNHPWFKKFAEHKNGIALLPVTQLATKKFANILNSVDLILTLTGKPDFINGNGQKNSAPPNGIMLVGAGNKAIEILTKSNLGTIWKPIKKWI